MTKTSMTSRVSLGLALAASLSVRDRLKVALQQDGPSVVEIRALVDELTVAGGDATFSELVMKIVSSRQFRNRQGQEKALVSLKA